MLAFLCGLALAGRECQHWGRGPIGAPRNFHCGRPAHLAKDTGRPPDSERNLMAQKTGKAQLSVSWGKCTEGRWCSFAAVSLAHDAFSAGGVYVIWHGGEKSRVVYVGQAAVLRDRLADHRVDKRILAYQASGLYVTWTALQAADRDGVETYLAARYAPLVGDRHPAGPPIVVNSPWD